MENILDKTEARNKVGGKADLAKELFIMLLKDLPRLKKHVNDAYEAQNAKDFWDHTHKIHGSTAYCGVPALKLCAKNLEDAIKQGKSFHEMKAELMLLNAAIDKLIDIGESEINSDWS